ncbi:MULTISPECIES: maleylpyruvate isomerase family mycothiol-dependent enzyme [unclassified Streptomyces]|uniref:maleylpyruvate isomerase family mycothiol-dependent enzyme n=1 Tax=unclassified Streptomyces TaxID=2593676 RepID=UPI00036DFB03|nr:MULTISPECIES: maleylpyruvate isomerase family mycothiol-dependent enzyme [unclassified Streptomyces]MYT32296.1 maleylpyruvate isomerase family mycothiol-dependent enzyme [Streptomyces sp. SID8354]
MSPESNDTSGTSWLGDPIDARPLFGSELGALLDTLRGLRPADWSKTAVPLWTVHDLASHILGDYYGRLGRTPGGYRRAFMPGETLEAFIHRTNQEWVELHADDSPASLIDALEVAGTQLAQRFATADLKAPALGVSWAGADPTPGWLDIAREFTEYWTHRQQIRHAIGSETDPEPHALSTVLDTFMRALPHTLRHTTAPAGAQIQVLVEGPVGGRWTVTATADRWSLAEPPSGRPTASVLLDTETAWRLCTRGIDPATALGRAHVQGERRLAEAACQVVSIVY